MHITLISVGKLKAAVDVEKLASSLGYKTGTCTTGNSLDKTPEDDKHMQANEAAVKDILERERKANGSRFAPMSKRIELRQQQQQQQQQGKEEEEYYEEEEEGEEDADSIYEVSY